MKILVISDKHDTQYFDIGTEEQELAAFLTVFEERNKSEYYGDLQTDDRATAESSRWYPEMVHNYDLATDEAQSLLVRGKAARRILEIRKSQGFEYEDDWSRETVMDALPAVLTRVSKRGKAKAGVA